MMTARRHRLSPMVHMIDDSGALCGARPREGRWLPNQTLPVTCPKCLWIASQPRYVYCQVPTLTTRPVAHIRLVGPEGVQKKAMQGSLKTLCGIYSGWDAEVVGATPAPNDPGCCVGCVRRLREARTGLLIYT